MGSANIVGHLAAFALVLIQAAFLETPGRLDGFLRADALSLFFIFTIATVNLAAALYSKGYIAGEVKEGLISEKAAKLYYSLFNVFTLSMFLVTLVENLGLMWVCVEMTTLASAFLVGFHTTKKAIEAAWKYVIICSVGLVLALVGVILFYYALNTGTGAKTLDWNEMLLHAGDLDPRLVKIAFIFILVGYGTKAGLAPMHTWLPDAHSQALTPISALLSCVLLKTSVYAILRFMVITNKAVGVSYAANLALAFGILSLGISAAFILVQKDIKRLLAYSSVEHIGVVFVGLGIGGTAGIFGALYHVFNHAVTKALMFFAAGSVGRKYGTHNMRNIRGVLAAMPFTGMFLLFGVFALGGLPPFSIFMSELTVLSAAFAQGRYAVAGFFMFFLAVIFAALVHHFSGVLFGEKPKDMVPAAEPASAKAAFILLGGFILLLGLGIPSFMGKLLRDAVTILTGV
jgi:hydrogenase-4 component F